VTSGNAVERNLRILAAPASDEGDIGWLAESRIVPPAFAVRVQVVDLGCVGVHRPAEMGAFPAEPRDPRIPGSVGVPLRGAVVSAARDNEHAQTNKLVTKGEHA